MRRRGAGLFFAALLAAGAAAVPARTQDAPGRGFYWPHRVFAIPVDTARIAQGGKTPTHLQLYAAHAGGGWQPAAKKDFTQLDDLKDTGGKKGFNFVADRDGVYEFSVQYHYKGGEAEPQRTDELTPLLKVTIDTTLPVVRLVAAGNGVEWSATDENLDPDGVRLQAKFPHWSEWKTITDRPILPTGRYSWSLQQGQTLDVRVVARDRAGNENSSAPVQVPGTGAFNTGLPKLGGGPDVGPVGGGPGLPSPRVEYVNTEPFDISYKIERAGRSGIQAAQLYVLADRAAGWTLGKRYPINPVATTGDSLKLPYSPPDPGKGRTADGTYGFYVGPESGAGTKADPPGPNTPPMVYVVYDTRPPFINITGVRVGAGGAKGPVVEITWETSDQNLLADPISLEYAEDPTAVRWKEIRYRLPPGTERQDADGLKKHVGQFAWEVPDEKLWKFYVKARSVDRAGNSSESVWKDAVIVDLEKPAATITGVRGGPGGGGGGGGAAPAPRPDPPPVVRPMPPPPAKKLPTPPMTDEPPAKGSGPALPDLPGTIPP